MSTAFSSQTWDRSISAEIHSLASPEVAIKSGLAEITYDTGATVVVEGPAEFTIGRSRERVAEDQATPGRDNFGYLSVGKLTARCDTAASNGFTVETPSGVVQDLGTEFGVSVDEQRTTALQVYNGLVTLACRLDTGVLAETIQVAEGESLSVDRGGLAGDMALLTPEQYDRVAEQNRNLRVDFAPQLTNGGFENRTRTSWQVLNPPGGGVAFRSGRDNRLRAQSGNGFVGLFDANKIANRGISQTFVTERDATYALTFYLARQTSSNVPDINVEVFDGAGFGDKNLATATFVIDWAEDRWQQRTMKFVAQSNTTTLRFQENGTSINVDPFIDTVKITAE